MSNIFYNRVIRKLVVGFGNMFNDITMVRYNPDNSESERFLVPIAYAAKEHYVMRLEQDSNLDKKVQMTLPRFSFEMRGMTYDSSRKQNTNIKNFAQTPTGVKGQYNPVPYNFDFDLNLYVRNIEDGTQVIEHIIPYFTPDYTIKLNLIPEMGIIKEVPVILNSVTNDTTYVGDRSSDPRMIIWTLNFTVKGFVFGPVTNANVITRSITSIYNKVDENDTIRFTMNAASGKGNYQLNELVYQGYDIHNATATGKVSGWANNKLDLTNINGDFISTEPIYGFRTNANYKFTSYNLTPYKNVQIDIRPNPANANATTPWVANTIITEYK
jgi:hypothetical protein